MLLMTRRFAEPTWNGDAEATAWTPSCDVLEDKDELKIVLELPGVKPEALTLSLENRTLTVRGEKKARNFERSFTLPATLDPEGIQATVEHGLLTVTLPKAAAAKLREIPIRVG